MKSHIAAGLYDESLAALYGGGEEVWAAQRARYAAAVEQFEKIYGGGREVALYSTPGRTEIGGNHTDHNHGIVLAAAVNLDIIAVVAKNSDGIARVHSKGFTQADSVDLAYLEPANTEFGMSAALVRGVAAGLKQRGGTVGGFDAYTTSNVLRGSGLSSSAAFEVCMGTIFNHEYNGGRFTPVEIAQVSQLAENKFFGKPSGLMDQMACSVGGVITIDFKEPEQPVVQQVPFQLSQFGYSMVVTDTKGSHANLTDEYAAIRREMEAVAARLGKKVLRDVPPEEFYAAIPALRGEVGDRAILRAMHFFEECRRALALAEAAREGAFLKFLALVQEGGHSSFEYNQNAYSVGSAQEQGVPLGLALSQHVLTGKGAWRLQGGGFAGTIQAFVPDDMVEQYCAELSRVFGRDACYVLNMRSQGSVPVGTKGL